MDDAIKILLEVQDRDIRLANLQRQVSSVPEEKDRITAELRGDEEQVEAARKAVADIEMAIKTVEMDIADVRNKKAKLQNRTLEKMKNEEYRLLLGEISHCDDAVRKLEDRELELWEDLDEAKGARRAAEKVLKQAQSRIDAALGDLDVRETNCRAQVAKVEAERAELTAQAPADLLRVYEQLTQRQGGAGQFRKGVAAIVNDSCGSCYLALPPNVRRRARVGEMVRCQQCGCIIYYDD